MIVIKKLPILKPYSIMLLCLLLTYALPSSAKDILKLNASLSSKKVSSKYNIEILHKAMRITEPEFGEYELDFVTKGIPNHRLREIIAEGNSVNLSITVSTPEWEELTVPIRIPVRRGVLNYRLLLINKNKLESFSGINTVEQLKKKTAGLRRQWATWEVMKRLGFNVVNSFSYGATFGMLDLQRFDYVPRGAHEIYEELAIQKSEFKNLMIEPNLALYMPAPFYVFVSPKQPRLIRRLKLGLSRMAEQGILEEMVNKYFGKYLEQADFKNRIILNLGNPILPPETPINKKELWLNWNL